MSVAKKAVEYISVRKEISCKAEYLRLSSGHLSTCVTMPMMFFMFFVVPLLNIFLIHSETLFEQ